MLVENNLTKKQYPISKEQWKKLCDKGDEWKDKFTIIRGNDLPGDLKQPVPPEAFEKTK